MKEGENLIDFEKLWRYIVESGIKQKVIARKAGIHESAFSLIITGKRKCSANEYARICSALGLKAEEFITDEPKEI